jgi:hypothetical protein
MSDDRYYDAEQEARDHARAVASLEATIATALATVHGATRADALRFLLEAWDVRDGDWEHLEWHLGVPYGYITSQTGRRFARV